ncbi:MAG: GNAT family N-acetyltransferase [Alphaproteobacteria bacterium]
MKIRSACVGDAAAIAAIYAPHVLTGLATFEEEPPTREEIAGRIDAVLAAGLPWLIAEDEDQKPLGYAYAAPYRARAAYRFTAESSIYLAEHAQGQGVGTALMTAVLAALASTQIRELVAVIGDSENAASRALHAKLGFRHVGTLENVGHKFGKSVDTVITQLTLK